MVVGHTGVYEYDGRPVAGHVVGELSKVIAEHVHARMIAVRQRTDNGVCQEKPGTDRPRSVVGIAAVEQCGGLPNSIGMRW
ncbi:hypothetical protein GCM10022284_11120 [Streptomyces hundungensis]